MLLDNTFLFVCCVKMFLAFFPASLSSLHIPSFLLSFFGRLSSPSMSLENYEKIEIAYLNQSLVTKARRADQQAGRQQGQDHGHKWQTMQKQ